MHPNPIFRKTETDVALSFARVRSFGTLALSTAHAPLLSHVPFLLSPEGDVVDFHLVRSNPICRAFSETCPATLAVTGPDGYVSPDWYGIDDQVPTWNYVAVHLTGQLEQRPEAELEALLAAQSDALEGFLPKTPWTMDKMSEDTKSRFMRMILPFRLTVTDVHSTFKLNQNKPDAARLQAARAIEEGFGSDLMALADMMRVPPSSS